MNYKEIKGYLIAIDLDGTVLFGMNEKDEESFSILKELAKNNTIVIATGRPWRSSSQYYHDLNLNTPIINYNGAYVHHPSDPNFEETTITIDHKLVQEFVRNAKDYLVNIFSEYKENIYLLKEEKSIEPYIDKANGNLIVGDYDEILNVDTNGSILFTKPGSEALLDEYIDKVWHKKILLRHWWTDDTLVSEFYNPLTSKANALERIRQYYHIPKTKTICIGDGHNDIEMIDYAAIGVAMGNSHPELLEHADVITEDVYDHGVAKFFQEYIFPIEKFSKEK